MTKCQKMLAKIDECATNASLYAKKDDIVMKDFWLAAMYGYVKKLQKMTIEECGEGEDIENEKFGN